MLLRLQSAVGKTGVTESINELRGQGGAGFQNEGWGFNLYGSAKFVGLSARAVVAPTKRMDSKQWSKTMPY